VPRACLFCGRESGSRSKEHVVPQWLQDYLSIREESVRPVVHEIELDEAGNFGAPATKHERGPFPLDALQLGVCEACNAGWMSDLESGAKPLLIPLIDGSRSVATVDRDERIIVARWTAKTAFAYNASSAYHKAVPEHPRILARGRFPDNFAVFAGQDEETLGFTSLQSRFDLIHPLADLSAKPEAAALSEASYKMSFRIGHLLLTSAFWPSHGWAMVVVRDSHTVLVNTAKVREENDGGNMRPDPNMSAVEKLMFFHQGIFITN
jgi:hypothetical protein